MVRSAKLITLVRSLRDSLSLPSKNSNLVFASIEDPVVTIPLTMLRKFPILATVTDLLQVALPIMKLPSSYIPGSLSLMQRHTTLFSSPHCGYHDKERFSAADTDRVNNSERRVRLELGNCKLLTILWSSTRFSLDKVPI